MIIARRHINKASHTLATFSFLNVYNNYNTVDCLSLLNEKSILDWSKKAHKICALIKKTFNIDKKDT